MKQQVNEIEVKEAKVCNGSCEACNCLQEEKTDIVFEAMFVSEQDTYHAKENKSFGVLVQKSGNNGWARLFWFPKSVCRYWKAKNEGCEINSLVHVSAPEWILKDRGILNIITIVK